MEKEIPQQPKLENDPIEEEKKEPLVEKIQLDKYYIDPDTMNERYQEIITIGKGSDGVVFKVKSKIDNKYYAIKRVITEDKKKEKRILNEISMIIHVNSNMTQFAKLFHYSQRDMSEVSNSQSEVQFELEQSEEPVKVFYYMIFEFCPMSLKSFFSDSQSREALMIIRKQDNIEGMKTSIIIDLLNAVRQLHQTFTVHRDLQPDNIMFRHTGQLVLIDLGYGQHFDEEQLTTSYFGSKAYMAPEIWVKVDEQMGYKPYKVDVFSAGMIILQVSQLSYPFNIRNQTELLKILKQDDFMKDFELEEQFKQLVQFMLKYQPKERYNFIDIYENVWVSSQLDKNQLMVSKEFYENNKDPNEAEIIESSDSDEYQIVRGEDTIHFQNQQTLVVVKNQAQSIIYQKLIQILRKFKFW